MPAIVWAVGTVLTVASFLALLDGCMGGLERINDFLLRLAYKLAGHVHPAYRVRYRHNPVQNYKVDGPESLV